MRWLNTDEDFKINFKEFGKRISPTLPGFISKGCISKEMDLDIPTDPFSDDILVKSKFLHLLKHDGLGFNIE